MTSVCVVLLSAVADGLQAPSITVHEAAAQEEEEEEEEQFSVSDVSDTESVVSATQPPAPKTVEDEAAAESSGPPPPPPPPPLLVEPTSSSQNLLTLPQTGEDHKEKEVTKKGGMTVAIARSFIVSTSLIVSAVLNACFNPVLPRVQKWEQ